MTRDVFNDDDGVVHHESRCNGQRHQGEVVDAVAEQVEHAEGSDEGNRNGDRGDHGGADAAKKNEYDQDHQADRNRHGLLDVQDGRANGDRAVADHAQIDGGGHGGLQLGKHGADPVHCLDDIGSRLAVDERDDSRFSVHEADIPNVFDRIDDVGDVGEFHGGAFAVGNHQRRVLARLQQLVGGGEGPGAVAVREFSFRPVGVRRGEHRPDVFQAQPAIVQQRGIDFHPHGRERAAAHENLSDAFHLGELLLKNRGRRIIDLT